MATTITITGDSIPLPKKLAKQWQDAQAEITESAIFVTTPLKRKAREDAWDAFLKGPKGLMRPSEIEREIQAYRAEKRRAGRS